MIAILRQAEAELPILLAEESAWFSLYVDYHPPFVERVWRQWGDYRIHLHRIHPCRAEEAYFHPHPWPAAMRIVSGSYHMGTGYGPGIQAPPVDAVLTMTAGCTYQMTDPNDWHYVQPITDVALTIMVTGKPWQREMPKKSPPLKPLDERLKREIISFFRSFDSAPLSFTEWVGCSPQ